MDPAAATILRGNVQLLHAGRPAPNRLRVPRRVMALALAFRVHELRG